MGLALSLDAFGESAHLEFHLGALGLQTHDVRVEFRLEFLSLDFPGDAVAATGEEERPVALQSVFEVFLDAEEEQSPPLVVDDDLADDFVEALEEEVLAHVTHPELPCVLAGQTLVQVLFESDHLDVGGGEGHGRLQPDLGLVFGHEGGNDGVEDLLDVAVVFEVVDPLEDLHPRRKGRVLDGDEVLEVDFGEAGVGVGALVNQEGVRVLDERGRFSLH